MFNRTRGAIESTTGTLNERSIATDSRSMRSFKPVILNSQEIQSRLKVLVPQSITSSLRDLEDEENILHAYSHRSAFDYYSPTNSQKKDYKAMLDQVISTHESIEMLLANSIKEVHQLKDLGNRDKAVLDELEDLIAGKGFFARGVKGVQPLSPVATIPPERGRAPSDSSHLDKSTQADSVNENQSYFESLERRHYVYMLEAFKSLRFSVDLFTPLEVKFPKKSKRVPEANKERIRIKGTLSEINSKLSRIIMTVPRLSTVAIPGAMTRRTIQSFPKIAKLLGGGEGGGVGNTGDMEIAIQLRLLTIDPFLVTQTNAFPRSRSLQLTQIYDRIEEIQWRLPEIADIRFSIKDILPLGLTQDDVYLRKYFQTKDPEPSYLEEFENARAYLRLLEILKKKRSWLRGVFVSYNVESMQTLPDVLMMTFSTFISLLKDAMLLVKDFDILEAAKIFYLSYVNKKKLPDSALSDEKSWLRALVMGSAFKENYHLRFPNFVEAIVRVVAVHPRFVRLTGVSLDEKMRLMFKRDLKPNVRMTQANFYVPYLADPFIIRAVYSNEGELHSMFNGYRTRISDVEKVTDFNERHGKLELRKLYALLSNSGILLDADIEQRMQDSVDDELIKMHPVERRKSLLRTRVTSKLSTIRFPSTLFEKADNKNLKIVASKNVRTFSPLTSLALPFYRPLRGKFSVDKLTVFNYFMAVMRSNDELFLAEPNTATDSKFVISFAEFCEAIGLIGMHFWKTTAACADLSMAEGVSYFIKIMIERHRFYREIRGLTSAKLMSESKEILSTYAHEAYHSELPLITKTVLAQERFIQRRMSA